MISTLQCCDNGVRVSNRASECLWKDAMKRRKKSIGSVSMMEIGSFFTQDEKEAKGCISII